MVGYLMEREPYWDYMARRTKEDRSVPEETYRTEIAQMQKQIHYLQMRVKELTEEVYDLRNHGPIQLELDV